MTRDLAIPPDIDRRVLAKAQQIGGDLTDPQAKIAAVQQFLLRNNSYSLTTDAGSGEPISNFILQRKVRPLRVFRVCRRDFAAVAPCADALCQRLLRA